MLRGALTEIERSLHARARILDQNSRVLHTAAPSRVSVPCHAAHDERPLCGHGDARSRAAQRDRPGDARRYLRPPGHLEVLSRTAVRQVEARSPRAESARTGRRLCADARRRAASASRRSSAASARASTPPAAAAVGDCQDGLSASRTICGWTCRSGSTTSCRRSASARLIERGEVQAISRPAGCAGRYRTVTTDV